MKLKLKPWIDSLPEYIAGKTIDEIRKKYNLKKVYKMASNENIVGPCIKVKQYIKKNLEDINYYPDSEAVEIRQKIADKFNVLCDNVIMGNGTDQIIEMLCDCFIDRKDNIVTSSPNFLIYEKATLKNGGDVIKVPLKEKVLKQDIEKILNSINKKTKIVFLTSPHNPTGTIIEADELKLIIKNTPRDVIIAIDEAYYEYIEEKDRIDTVSLVRENLNLLTLRTFSKIYGLAGLRIGYAIACQEIISALNKIRLPFNTTLISQRAAVIALENDWYIEKIRQDINIEKRKFYDAFDELGIDYIKSYANFILVKIGIKSRIIIEKLLESSFIVRPGENLGVPGYIRITISTSKINEKFLKKFKEIYSLI